MAFTEYVPKEENERRGRATRRIIMMMNNTKKLNGLKTLTKRFGLLLAAANEIDKASLLTFRYIITL